MGFEACARFASTCCSYRLSILFLENAWSFSFLFFFFFLIPANGGLLKESGISHCVVAFSNVLQFNGTCNTFCCRVKMLRLTLANLFLCFRSTVVFLSATDLSEPLAHPVMILFSCWGRPDVICGVISLQLVFYGDRWEQVANISEWFMQTVTLSIPPYPHFHGIFICTTIQDCRQNILSSVLMHLNEF